MAWGFDSIRNYGQSVRFYSPGRPEGWEAGCFIEAFETTDGNAPNEKAYPGTVDTRRYRLVAAAGDVDGADPPVKVRRGEDTFLIMRMEPMYFAGGITHWEGVLRPVREASENA